MTDLFSDIELVALSNDREHFLISFPYDQGRNEKLKQLIPAAKRNRDTGMWQCPATADNADLLRRMLGKFAWTDEALNMRSAAKEVEEQRVEASKAESAELHIPGFQVEPFPFQKAGILYALDRKRVIIGDEMGLGKTIQGLATIYAAEAFPAVVITPASLKYNWGEREIPRCMPDRNVVIADKDTPPLLLRMADVIVTNYEQLVGFRTFVTSEGKKTRTSWKDETKKEVVLSPLAERLLELKLKAIVCDEAHYLKEGDAARTKAAREIRKGTEYRLLLTGTPMMNKPSEFASLLQFIDRLDEFGGWWSFMTKYCGMTKGRYGLEAKGATNSLDLNRRLRASCYVRRQKKDVLKELPPKTRGSYQVEIDNWAEYKKAEDELVEWVKEQVRKNKEFLASIAHLSKEEQEDAIRIRQEEKAAAAERGERMVRFQALKIITSRGKLKAACEWINNFLESGEKLVIFATHKEIIEALLAKYPNAVRIISEDSDRERQKNVGLFQTDKNIKIIICAMGTSATNSPGGIGHTLTAASNVLFLELGWNPALHDQCEDRCHRIGQQDNVTAHYLLGRNTIELDIAELIEGKRAVCKQVVDGIEEVDEAGILEQLMERLANR
jgi:SWI/SNF-related matrix-associated actin-dependent regulator 1 of chromatin subfamily A